MMNIGRASKLTGLPVKTVRYYEEIGLVVAHRAENGYRCYRRSDIHKLRFVQRARGLGFSIDHCRALLSLYEDKDHTRTQVKEVAKSHLFEIETKMADLESLRDVLSDLIDHCADDTRPKCPIFNDHSKTLPSPSFTSPFG